MLRTGLLILFAYLSGSVLYANVFGNFFGIRDRYAESVDQNPGTANAYTYGGFWCGTLTLVCELLKGAVPVFLAAHMDLEQGTKVIPLVMVAAVAGHIFPLFYHFRGGKGIAVTFGTLLGLLPYWKPFLIFAAVFIFLSVAVCISPHYYRTLAAYVVTLAIMPLTQVEGWACFAFLMITLLVWSRMLKSDEEKEKMEVRLLWKR